MRKRVLIVEDDLDVALGLDIRLKANDYETFVASDALSAVAMANKEKPDLILLDLGLPDADGIEVLNTLRSNPSLASIPAIVLTGRDPVHNMNKSYQAGATAFF